MHRIPGKTIMFQSAPLCVYRYTTSMHYSGRRAKRTGHVGIEPGPLESTRWQQLYRSMHPPCGIGGTAARCGKRFRNFITLFVWGRNVSQGILRLGDSHCLCALLAQAVTYITNFTAWGYITNVTLLGEMRMEF